MATLKIQFAKTIALGSDAFFKSALVKVFAYNRTGQPLGNVCMVLPKSSWNLSLKKCVLKNIAIGFHGAFSGAAKPLLCTLHGGSNESSLHFTPQFEVASCVAKNW